MMLFGKRNECVGYVHTQALSIFALYDIGTVDAGTFVTALDCVDKSHGETINLNDFAKKYCGEWGYVLKMFWDKYKSILTPVSRKEDISNGNHSGTTGSHNDHHHNDHHRSDSSKESHLASDSLFRLEFTGFILFIMSFHSKDLPKLIYWLWYYLSTPKVKPTVDNLCTLIDFLWGPNIEINQKKKLMGLKGECRHVLQSVDMDEYDVKKFQIYDWRIHGAWSMPLQNMCKSIQLTMIGQWYWRRISSKVIHLLEGSDDDIIDNALSRLEDKKLRGLVDHKDKGERKLGRKAMRRYVRLVRSFYEMPAAQHEEFNGGDVFSQGAAAVGRVIERIFSLIISCERHAKVSPVSASARALSLAILSRARSAATGGGKTGGGRGGGVRLLGLSTKTGDRDREMVVPAVPLEVKYSQALVTPADELFRRARQARSLAKDLVLECKEECVPVPSLAAVGGAVTLDKEEDKGDDKDEEDDKDNKDDEVEEALITAPISTIKLDSNNNPLSKKELLSRKLEGQSVRLQAQSRKIGMSTRIQAGGGGGGASPISGMSMRIQANTSTKGGMSTRIQANTSSKGGMSTRIQANTSSKGGMSTRIQAAGQSSLSVRVKS